ncbi:acetyl-CoA C-acyltransferase [Paracoccus jeotgali]|uniref:Acetyl-CoA C-acyltransferase n=1 Tax=Paracoccus jeotgali TaxID=2065379 RepID=A0A2K9MIJ0_9RHOB|nr:acetyl-CoA C-acyltransferase [Paracoccus jeotgali]AUM74856.1 acetyl-CoA C-acyltransferase [Paracoccus jeotgali]
MQTVIIDAIRTPRGRGTTRGGALSSLRAADLLAGLYREIAARHPGVEALVGDALIGCVTQTGDQGSNIGKVAALRANWPDEVPAATINRFCASGLSAVNAAAAQAQVNDSVVLGGGVEMMSRTPMFSDNGVLFADKDVARSARSVHPVLGADLVATQHDISRADCDAYAALSQQRAEAARARGAFTSIIPVRDASGAVLLDQDETIRSGVTAESLSGLDPVFEKVGDASDVAALLSGFPDLHRIVHVHHAGNAPAMADGAALVLMAGEDAAKRHGLTPRARILATAEANVAITQTGAVDASRLALQRAGLSADDIDLWEVRDSFAAVTLHYIRAFDLSLDKFNVNGSSIALGHPMGATGAMLVGTLLDEMDARDLRYGLVAIAGAAGVASAAVIERIPT